MQTVLSARPYTVAICDLMKRENDSSASSTQEI